MRGRRWVGTLLRAGDPMETERPSEADRAPPGAAPWRRRLDLVMESPGVQYFITAVIMVNAVTLGLETSARAMAEFGGALKVIDSIALTVFVVEIALKLAAKGFRFFRNFWNVFDFIIVGIALVPAQGAWSVLRAFRILRALRLVSVIPALRRVVAALLASIPGVSSILALLLLVFYVFGVICTKLYGQDFPQWFGTVGDSMYSLFQIMTLESWSMGIVRPVMEVHPNAWFVFVVFILISSFAVLNLFIAVIVNAMTEEQAKEAEASRREMREAAHLEAEEIGTHLRAVSEELAEMRAMLSQREGNKQ